MGTLRSIKSTCIYILGIRQQPATQYLEDPATELSMLHKYPNVKALFDIKIRPIRLFRHLHRSIVYSALAVWYMPLKENACQTKCLKHCWCWRQMPTCVPNEHINYMCWLHNVLYWLVGSSGHCVLFELSAKVAWHFHFLPNWHRLNNWTFKFDCVHLNIYTCPCIWSVSASFNKKR